MVAFHWALGLFVATIALTIFGGFAQFWIVVEMSEQINRLRPEGQRVVWPPDISRTSWKNGIAFWGVWKEYRALYPGGKLSRLLAVWMGLMVISWITAVYLLFGVLPA